MQQLYRPFIFRLLLGLLAALLASTQWLGTVQAQTYPQNQIIDEQGPVDYQTYSAADESFRIEIPAHWQTIKLSATTLDSGLDLLETENPQLKAFFNSPTFRQLVATGMKFYAIDLSDQGATYALPINVNVLKLDTGVDLSLAAVKKLNERQLAALADPAYPITSEIVTIQAQEAVRFQYVFNYRFGLVTQLTQITQILLVDNQAEYVVTIGAPLTASAEYQTTVDHILQSFRLARLGEPTPATPTPTPQLSLPTPTASPAPLATVRNSSLNLRNNPGMGAGIIGHVNQGDELKVVGQVANCAWLQVQTSQQQQGWVAGAPQFVTLNAACNTIPVKNIHIISINNVGRGQGCLRFENNLNAELTITFTSGDGKWNDTFHVGRKAKAQHCFAPGVYTYTIDAPPPWGGFNGKIDITPGLRLTYPVNPGS